MKAPEISANLKDGHTRECLNLRVSDYPEVQEIIASAVRALKDATLEDEVLEDDDKFAEWVHGHLPDSDFKSYGELLTRTVALRRELTRSGLDEPVKARLWRLIFECYRKVCSAIYETIPPLADRELLQDGDVFEAKVTFRSTEMFGPPNYDIDIGQFRYSVAVDPETYGGENLIPFVPIFQTSSRESSYFHDQASVIREKYNLMVGIVTDTLKLKVVAPGRGLHGVTHVEIVWKD